MPSTRTFIRSWHGGILAPQMFGRIDSVQFQSGAEQVSNWGITPQGALYRRPGLEDGGAAKSQAAHARLIDFDAGPDDAVMLELGNGYMRFWRDLEPILVTGARPFQIADTCTMAIGSTVTQANHTHQEGDPVQFTTTGSLPPQLTASTTYYVRNVVPLTSYELSATPTGPVIVFTVASTPTTTARRVYVLGDLVRDVGLDYYCRAFNTSATPASNPSLWYVLADAGGGSSIYEIPTLYTTAQLRDLNYDQVNDVVTITHKEQYPQELRRYDETLWTLVGVQLEASRLPPTGLEGFALRGDVRQCIGISIGVDPTLSFDAPHGLLPGDGIRLQDFVFTPATIQLQDGFYKVFRTPATTSLRVRLYDNTVPTTAGLTVTTLGNMQVWDREVQADSFYAITTQAQVDGSESDISTPVVVFNKRSAPGARNLLTWDEVSGASRYLVYRKENDLWFYIGEVDGKEALRSSAISFTLAATGSTINWNAHPMREGEPFRLSVPPGGSLPTGTSIGNLSASTTYFVRKIGTNSFYFSDKADGLPITGGVAGVGTTTCTARRYFGDDDINVEEIPDPPPTRDADDLVTAGNYPAAVGHHQQRRVFGGTTNEAQTFWMAKAGTESDFSYHLPAQSDDRIEWEIGVRRRADIRHIIPLQDLLMLTGSSEVRVRALGSDVLGANNIETLAQTHIGCSRVRPQLSQGVVTFVSRRDQHVIELRYSVTAQGYDPNDISLRAVHLFDEHTILESAQARAPWPVDFWLRDDGTVLCVTYIPSEQVTAWWTLSTDGVIESIAVAREGEQDRLYCQVARQVDGVTVRRIERLGLWTRDLDQAIGVDSARVVVPTSAVISDLTHLEGETVTIVADGRTHPSRLVSGGQIVLQSAAYSRVVIGRGYNPVMDSLPLVLSYEAYVQGRSMNVTEAVLRVVESAGRVLLSGINGQPRPLWPNQTEQQRTGDFPITMSGKWDLGGKLRLEAPDPLPVLVAAMTLQVSIGD